MTWLVVLLRQRSAFRVTQSLMQIMSLPSVESLEGVSSAACAEQSEPQPLNRNDESNKPEPRRKRQLQGGFECVFVEEPPKQFQTECAICLCVLKDPYLVDCCCNSFCQSCIKPVQEDDKPCPLCNTKFTTCIPDKRLQRTLNEMKVYCPHREFGCQWSDELIKLSQHLNVAGTEQFEGCSFALIECTFCQRNFQRKDFKEHKSSKCPQRPYSCDYCNDYESTCEDVTTNHWPVCPSRPVPCPNQCGVYPEHKKLDEHLSQQCSLADIKCPFDYAGCTCELPRKDLEVHLSEKLAYHMSLQAISHKQQLASYQSEVAELKGQLETLIIEKQKIAERLTEEKKEMHDYMNDVEIQLRLNIEELKEENEVLRRQLEQQAQEITELEDKLDKDCKCRVKAIREEIKLTQDQKLKDHLGNLRGEIKRAQNETKQEIMKDVGSDIAVVHDHVGLVPVSFTMPGFQLKKTSNSSWYSPSFYTHPRGYKMCLRVDANGWGDGKNSHVGVALYMMQGEYDISLKWPFQGVVTIMLLNQVEDCGHFIVDIPVTDIADGKFCNKVVLPQERSVNGFGSPVFFHHSNLLPNFLKYNCLKLCIKQVKLNN